VLNIVAVAIAMIATVMVGLVQVGQPFDPEMAAWTGVLLVVNFAIYALPVRVRALLLPLAPMVACINFIREDPLPAGQFSPWLKLLAATVFLAMTTLSAYVEWNDYKKGGNAGVVPAEGDTSDAATSEPAARKARGFWDPLWFAWMLFMIFNGYLGLLPFLQPLYQFGWPVLTAVGAVLALNIAIVLVNRIGGALLSVIALVASYALFITPGVTSTSSRPHDFTTFGWLCAGTLSALLFAEVRRTSGRSIHIVTGVTEEGA